jgi:sec-independent protein translocase protein TatA
MFGLGWQELLIILFIAFLIFGAKKLPEVGKSVGQAIVNFKKGAEEAKNEIVKETKEIEKTVKNDSGE